MLFHYRGAIVATDQTATFIGDIDLPLHEHATLYYRATSSGGSDAVWAEAFPNERLDGFHTVCAYEVFRKVCLVFVFFFLLFSLLCTGSMRPVSHRHAKRSQSDDSE